MSQIYEHLDAILKNLNDGTKIDSVTLESFRREFKQLDDEREVLRSWIQPGTNKPVFPGMRVTDNPIFQKSPLNYCLLAQRTDEVIPTGVGTYLEFDTITNFGNLFSCAVPASKIYFKQNAFTAFAMIGSMTWQANATGYRNLFIEGFDANDVSLGGQSLVTLDSFAGVTDVTFPIAMCFYMSMAYFKVRVTQTSGGDLTIKDVTIGLFQI